ncbi:MAG TPA: hypothetical protein VE615_10250 [Gaiellaceae bacterium]|jgi:hypothetical protein|nr:hypothetical protein [Gaiellaceae bacterium]
MEKRQLSRAAAVAALSKNRGELEPKVLDRMLTKAGAFGTEPPRPAENGAGPPSPPLR